MRSRFSLIAASLLILAVVSSAAPAAVAQAADVFVTPIPNAPFSGMIHVERSVVRPDGSVISRKTVRNIARDTQGRIRNEYRMLLPVSSTETPQVTQVLIYDPQTRTSTMLYPSQQTFTTGTVNRPPETVPPGHLGNGVPPNDFTKEEDLGVHDMAGVMAHGVREVQTIPAEKSSTGKEIVITDEYWYSDELRINVVIKHSDPRTGSVAMIVSQVNRNEPDPALFVVPDGFKAPAPRAELKH
jgi:hypothetical protein